MKITKIFSFLLMTAVLLSFTNKDKILSLIEEQKSCKTSTQYFELANKYETIEPSGNQDWYPNYYAAYNFALSAFASQDYSNIDVTLDLAQQHIDKAKLISPDNDEILCVASMIYSARIMVDPAERGYKYGQKSGLMLEKALFINTDNPRTLFLMGQSKIYIPVGYGGGCENAIPILKSALKKYESFEKTHEYSPDWGKAETQELLKSCL